MLRPEQVSLITGIIKDDFLVNDDTTGGCSQSCPVVAMDASGNFVISWHHYRNDFDNLDIYAQRYGSFGDTLGRNFRVNDDEGTSWQADPSVAMDGNGGFVICWQDERNGDWDIYAQRYYADGTPWGRNYVVNQRPDVLNPNQLEPSVAANSGQISFAWMDLRRSKGWDIYAKVVSWDWDKVEEPGDEGVLPKDFTLLQNYPNPFNSVTAISYQLSAVRPHLTSLKVYNILGQEVRTLVDEVQPAGNFRILWDGRDGAGKDVSSGVYFYSLKVIGDRLKVEKTRRMVLIR